jgi:Na+/phosphate symporter
MPSLVISIPIFIITIAGLIIYLAAANPKASEIGRIMFMVGLFFVCAAFAGTRLFQIP